MVAGSRQASGFRTQFSDALLDWWYDFGRADAREWKPGNKWLRMGNILLKVTLPTNLRWQLAISRVKRFCLRCQVWKTFGWINELRRVTPRKHEQQCAAPTLEPTRSASTRHTDALSPKQRNTSRRDTALPRKFNSHRPTSSHPPKATSIASLSRTTRIGRPAKNQYIAIVWLRG